ncbi:Pinoresinol reductase 1 [Pseudocercospora fuligena]|uniref:Pinoresinol reductase 1 n=1 Tax=Pseudocercospora fuligena TaxID=685502 RepID=A0A8H6RAN0_9PEZI|nr:Pinoresinol reductase 1 [Pseudocercospora fuligena]
MAYTKVAVSGATGNLGPAVVEQLVNAGLDVTILSQSGKTTGLPSSVKVTRVDYSSQDSLISALKGNEAYVCLVPDHGSQPALIDAAIAAGIQRFIPSEFGSNVSGNSKTAALPVFAGKKKTQDYLATKASEISYTVVVNGLFLDWGIQAGLIANLKGGKTTLYDGGDTKFSSTKLSDIGKAVAGILKHPEETKNRTVYIQTALITQNKILNIAKKLKPDVKIDAEDVKIADVEKNAYEALQQGGDRIGEAMFGFIKVSIMDPECGANWSSKNDNALLGIEDATDEDLEKIVAQLL